MMEGQVAVLKIKYNVLLEENTRLKKILKEKRHL